MFVQAVAITLVLDAHLFNFVFEQLFYRLAQRVLDLTHAHRINLAGDGSFNQHLSKPVRFARATATVRAEISRAG